ncbi:MAG: DUF1273 domain-containing protein [Clostridiales bacterium]|nr:DUF1273 domain-containing protein [Clostridiales bacterium]
MYRENAGSVRPAKNSTCCFSGYRPEKLPWGENEEDERCRELKRRLFHISESLRDAGYRHFMCGMARGSDIYFCEAVLLLRDIYPDVTIEAALPCPEQADRWPRAWRERYFELVRQCDRETLISMRYTKDCMRRRNKFMVDNSALIITVFDGRPGGTMATRRYAISKGLEIIDLMP